MTMLEKTLQETLNRYNQINKYGKKLIFEQDLPTEPGGDVPPPDAGVPPTGAPPTGAPTDAPPDAGAPPTGDTPPDAGMPDAGAPDALPEPSSDTEELDITDLVNMTKSIKKDLEDKTNDSQQVTTKMDDMFTKLENLEQKLSEMDQIIAKIDALGPKIDSMREPKPEEKLQLRSLDSFPFSKNPQEFFAEKQDQMRASGKNEYVLTKDDVQNYSNDTIKSSFNPQGNNGYKF